MCPMCVTTAAVLLTGGASAVGLGTLLVLVAGPRRRSGTVRLESGAPAKGERNEATENRLED
jgi:hypothetical protein